MRPAPTTRSASRRCATSSPASRIVCFRKCAAVCKAGDICSALATNDRFACVPEKPGLCQPCALNVDCPYPGDRCLEIGGTKVCARDCSFDGQCPTSYRCADGTDTNGAYVTKQCQPTSGTCECTAVSAGQTTPCQESNSLRHLHRRAHLPPAQRLRGLHRAGAHHRVVQRPRRRLQRDDGREPGRDHLRHRGVPAHGQQLHQRLARRCATRARRAPRSATRRTTTATAWWTKASTSRPR